MGLWDPLGWRLENKKIEKGMCWSGLAQGRETQSRKSHSESWEKHCSIVPFCLLLTKKIFLSNNILFILIFWSFIESDYTVYHLLGLAVFFKIMLRLMCGFAWNFLFHCCIVFCCVVMPLLSFLSSTGSWVHAIILQLEQMKQPLLCAILFSLSLNICVDGS